MEQFYEKIWIGRRECIKNNGLRPDGVKIHSNKKRDFIQVSFLASKVLDPDATVYGMRIEWADDIDEDEVVFIYDDLKTLLK